MSWVFLIVVVIVLTTTNVDVSTEVFWGMIIVFVLWGIICLLVLAPRFRDASSMGVCLSTPINTEHLASALASLPEPDHYGQVLTIVVPHIANIVEEEDTVRLLLHAGRTHGSNNLIWIFDYRHWD